MASDNEEERIRTIVESGAYMCAGATNQGLVENLERNGLIEGSRVKEAMLTIDRGDFAHSTPYEDFPVFIGYGATISAPHMHAIVLSCLKDHLVEGKKALDIGSGSGYLTACMAIMIGRSGKAVGVEHVKELVDISINNIKRNHEDLISSGRIILIEGDGRKGYEAESPYDVIHVGAAASSFPNLLIDQLAPNGRMLIPIESNTGEQILYQYDKSNDGIVKKKSLFSVLFVPLTDLPSKPV